MSNRLFALPPLKLCLSLISFMTHKWMSIKKSWVIVIRQWPRTITIVGKEGLEPPTPSV